MNQNTVPPTWDKKDWPITFVFYDRSEIDKVKDAIGWPRSGNTKYGRLNDGPQSNNAWLWDQDNGSKVSSCDDWHYRSYAPNPPDYMYNSSWGQYTLVTTHRDLNDCDNGLQAQYGWSETAEGNIAVRINNYVITQPQYSGWAMAQDAWNMGNGGFTSFWEGCCRYVQNNGMATRVDVFP